MDQIPNDERLDALLRDVAVPQTLAARLREITIPSDDDLDQLLCGVAMPEHLSMLLHAIPDDELLDARLQEVHTPFTLREQVQLVTPEQQWQTRGTWFVRLAVAAALFMAVSATFLTSTAAYLTSVYPPAPDPQWVVLAAVPETWQASLESPAVEIGAGCYDDEPELSPDKSLIADVSPVEAALMDNWDETFAPPTLGGPVAQWQSLVKRGLRPWEDVVLLQWGLLGAPQYSEDELPDLTRVRLHPRSGLDLPQVRGYDRIFFLKESIFPPVSPAANAKLQVLDIPLSTSTATLNLAEAALASGKSPDRDEVRVEHFLASLESRFPAAARGQLALHVQGAPSPFGTSDAYLLQVGVQAGKLQRESKQPTHLVIALDVSASMARGGRLEMVRHALNQVHRQLGIGDALSLVAFDEAVVCRVEHLAADQGDELREQLLELIPHSGTNLAAGLQTAASVALTEPATEFAGNYRTRLVLITDSRAAMPDDTADKIAAVMSLAGAEGVGFDVLDVSGRSAHDPLLDDLTKELGGSYRAIGSRQQLYASLVESLAGHNPAVANEAQLRIRFDPQTVAAYRLIGHEPNLLAQVVPAAVDAQLLPEECSGALLEIWFTRNPSTSLGQATVSWKDPATKQLRQRQLPLIRGQFASAFSETPASLQTAAVAAEIAEQIRGSREALRRENLLVAQGRNNAATIRTVIRPWSLTLRQEPDLNRLLTLLDQLEKTRGR